MMETEFTWNIVDLIRNADNDMIFSISWRLEAVQGQYYASAAGSTGLTPTEDPIPFIDLTPELVQDWLLAALGDEQVKGLQDGLAGTLAEKAAPPTLNGTPW